jgi:hypothetical protein
MRVLDAVLVCVCFEIGILVGSGFAMCLRDECVGLGLCANKYVWTCGVSRVGLMSSRASVSA